MPSTMQNDCCSRSLADLDCRVPDGSVNAGMSHVFHVERHCTLTARIDVITLFDRECQRNGTGVGFGAPQYGPRRGYSFGLSKSL